MYGFLNVLAAAAFATTGAEEGAIRELLEEESRSEFNFGQNGISYRGKSIALEEISEMRAKGMASFGSCSFEEPVRELSDIL